jgi:Fe(3+) dicitrate transport protein
MDFRRLGAQVAVNHMFTANLTSTTNFFGHYISRDWTRQAIAQQNPSNDGCVLPLYNISNAICSNATQAIPVSGQFTNAREYWVYGIEPRFHYNHSLFGINAEADFGARYMYEESNRIQFQNQISLGPPRSCFVGVPGNTCLGENNVRTTNAYAVFFQERFIFGKFTITPGVRFEHFKYEQTNALPNIGAGTSGSANFTEVLPGVGATYQAFKDHTLFIGAHKGMSPPLISDAVTGTGAVVDLDPELSWTYEVGARGNVTQWAGYELTLFQMDFSNQIISQSAAGGVGSTLTSAGETRHRGIEFATKLDLLDAFTGPNRDQDIILDLNYTWIAEAEFIGTKNTSLGCISLLPQERVSMGCASPSTGNPVNPASVSGNRLPYSPKNLFTGGIAYNNRAFSVGAFNARLEAQCVSDQFGDDINLQNATPNGQRGIVRGWCMLNASINQYVKKINTNFFFVGKNMLGQDAIMDRTRGIYPGLPALWQAGAKWTF